MCKKYKDLGPEVLPKISNDADKTETKKPFQYLSCSAWTFLFIQQEGYILPACIFYPA